MKPYMYDWNNTIFNTRIIPAQYYWKMVVSNSNRIERIRMSQLTRLALYNYYYYHLSSILLLLLLHKLYAKCMAYVLVCVEAGCDGIYAIDRFSHAEHDLFMASFLCVSVANKHIRFCRRALTSLTTVHI